MLASLASSAASGEGIIKLLTGTGNDQNYIIVPVSADRGLCGGFNSSINRETYKIVKSLEGDGKNVQIMPLGKKSRDFFNRVMKDQIIESFVDLNSRVNQFLNERIKDGNEKEIILFSHGGPIRSALNIALNNKEVNVGAFNIENLKVTKIVYLNGNWQIDYVNK